MTPPETQGQGIAAEVPAGSPEVSLCVLQKRAEENKDKEKREEEKH